MKKKNKTLVYWLFYIIIGGAFIMGLVMVIISMVMYMQSVRRIYKRQMLESAGAAIELAGFDDIRQLCEEKLKGGVPDEELVMDAEASLEQIYDEAGLTDLSLYCFDETTMKGELIATAYPERSYAPSDISFGKIELERLLNAEASRDLKRHGKKGFDNTVYKDIRNENNEIIGLLSVSMELGETLTARIRFLVFYVPVFVLLMSVFSFITLRLIKRKIIIPISELTDAAKRFGNSDISAGDAQRIPVFNRVADSDEDEIGTLWKTCSEMETSLYESVRKLKAATAEKERQTAEVEVASQIQNGMMPSAGALGGQHPELGIAGSLQQAKGVGGDFYDYFMIDDDHLAIVIGDVSGKGIPASLFMMMAMTQIRMHSSSGLGPASINTEANRAICANNPEMMFVTIWMGVVEISKGVMLECNAGHEYPVLRNAGEDYELDESEHDIPCGLMDDTVYTEKRRILQSGDRIFVYSDGLPEANNVSEEQFGTDRILKTLNEKSSASDEELLQNMKAAVFEFMSGAPQFDDLTMVSFSYNR